MHLHISRASFVLCGLAICSLMSWCAPASAGIIQTTGAARVRNAPPSVQGNFWESNTRVRVFEESTNIFLEGDIAVDFISPGTYRNRPQMNQGVIAAGTSVNSYLIHKDSKDDALIRLTGSIKFDEIILGVIVKKTRIADTDGLLGSPTTSYEEFIDLGRGLEMRRRRDAITLSQNMKRISFNLLSSDGIDQIRVITLANVVPGPGSMALLGLAALIAPRRRRRA